MTIRFYFRQIDKVNEDRLRDYLAEKKLGRLTRLLQHGNLELAELELRVEHSEHHNIFSVKLDLIIAKNNLAAHEDGHNLIEAFDLAFDNLINRLRKLESIRHDNLFFGGVGSGYPKRF